MNITKAALYQARAAGASSLPELLAMIGTIEADVPHKARNARVSAKAGQTGNNAGSGQKQAQGGAGKGKTPKGGGGRLHSKPLQNICEVKE